MVLTEGLLGWVNKANSATKQNSPNLFTNWHHGKRCFVLLQAWVYTSCFWVLSHPTSIPEIQNVARTPTMEQQSEFPCRADPGSSVRLVVVVVRDYKTFLRSFLNGGEGDARPWPHQAKCHAASWGIKGVCEISKSCKQKTHTWLEQLPATLWALKDLQLCGVSEEPSHVMFLTDTMIQKPISWHLTYKRRS